MNIANKSRSPYLRFCVGALAALCLMSCSRGRDETILIPEGFTGPVVIQFSQPGGAPVEMEGQAVLFRVPRDGVLKTQAGPVRWVTNTYYYVSPSGKRTLLPHDRDGELDEMQVFAEQSGMGACTFMVGRADMWENPRTVLSERFREVLGIGSR